MGVWDKFKRDIAKHRGRAAILGVLFIAMVGMSIRAVLQLQPRSAAAAPAVAALPAQIQAGRDADQNEDAVDAQARIEQSKTLWKVLRQVKADATDAKAAFTFDPAYYPPPMPAADSNRPILTGPAIVEIKTAPLTQPAVEDPVAKANRIREEARALIVKSTTVGNGNAEPVAIVNQQVVTKKQKILGFEVTAIRSREVEFVKEGVTVVGKMPDGQ